MFVNGNESGLRRGMVILAPPQADLLPFQNILGDPSRHEGLLAEAQTLRGKIYLQDGAIHANQLTADGRHVQDADDRSWHLLTVDRNARVTACIRYRAHRTSPSYFDLGVAEAVQHQPPAFGEQVKRAVQGELGKADRLGFSYVELGGWVVSEELRCSTEAIRMLLMMYALSQVLGGAIALSTATRRHNSSTILRRTGGKPLVERGEEIPSYFDPQYGCEMEMLSFDSRSPNPRYNGWIREFREAMTRIPVVSRSYAATTREELEVMYQPQENRDVEAAAVSLVA